MVSDDLESLAHIDRVIHSVFCIGYVFVDLISSIGLRYSSNGMLKKRSSLHTTPPDSSHNGSSSATLAR